MTFVIASSVAFFMYSLVLLVMAMSSKEKIAIEKELDSMLKKNDYSNNQYINSSASDRILKPIVTTLYKIIGVILPIRVETKEKTEQKLAKAGIKMNAQDYIYSQILKVISVAIMVFLVLTFLNLPLSKIILFDVIAIYAVLIINRFSISSKMTARKQEMYSQFPNVLDLLYVSVSAGLGFDQSIGYIVSKSEGALIDEFAKVQRATNLGKPRKEALTEFAKRCNSQEINTFVVSVTQADELGTSMQSVLKIQSESIRKAHKQKVEEEAQKLSVKILIPMIMFIFPVIFIILLGPAIPSLLEAIS